MRDFNRNNRGGNRDRQMFPAVCSNCGRDCEVPFQPTGSKPVLCSDCFKNSGNNRRSDRPNNNSRGPQRRDGNRGGDDQLRALNAKLDRILDLLEGQSRRTQIEEEPGVEATVENVELQPEETIVLDKKKKSKKSEDVPLE